MDRHSFYTSKKWLAVRKEFIAEHTDAQGMLICEFCGKPILDAPDVHHKIHLTDDNWKNAEISLNKANLMLLHHQCHNMLHNKYCGNTPKRVVIVCGAPASKKLQYAKEKATKQDIIVSLDLIMPAISTLGMYEQTAEVSKMAFAVRKAMLEAIRLRQGSWHTAYIVEALPSRAKREEYKRIYNAEIVEMQSTKEECYAVAEAEGRGSAYFGYIDMYFAEYTS
jgi:hypothetical protein